MACDDPAVRMRAADAVERATAALPELLEPKPRERLAGESRIVRVLGWKLPDALDPAE